MSERLLEITYQPATKKYVYKVHTDVTTSRKTTHYDFGFSQDKTHLSRLLTGTHSESNIFGIFSSLNNVDFFKDGHKITIDCFFNPKANPTEQIKYIKEITEIINDKFKELKYTATMFF